MSKLNEEMKRQRFIELAAQAWCKPDTQHLVMQPALAMEFACILEAEVCRSTSEQEERIKQLEHYLTEFVSELKEAYTLLHVTEIKHPETLTERQYRQGYLKIRIERLEELLSPSLKADQDKGGEDE